MKINIYKIVVVAALFISFTACGDYEPAVSNKGVESGKSASVAAVETGTTRKAEKISVERKDCKVSPKLSVKEQLRVIEEEKDKWWYNQGAENEGEYEEIFAVTDFNQNGYLELLVQQNQKGKAALFEVNESGSGLTACEVSQKVFSYLMDNPLCAYYEEKTAKWHIAEEIEKTDGMKKVYMCFRTESCADKDDLITDLEESWESFAVYEPQDVSQWEKKLTKEEREQIRLIAETMKNFGRADSGVPAGYAHEYAVCDLNQDGVLELLDRYWMGSGIIRQYYRCYAVDKEGVRVVLDEADRINNPEKYGENGFTYLGMGVKIVCCQDKESGEIFYVFSAATGLDESKEKDYKMVWDNHILNIQPFKEKETENADKKGEASLYWVKRSSMACGDYQYENALVSYLGWGIQWNSNRK